MSKWFSQLHCLQDEQQGTDFTSYESAVLVSIYIIAIKDFFAYLPEHSMGCPRPSNAPAQATSLPH